MEQECEIEVPSPWFFAGKGLLRAKEDSLDLFLVHVNRPYSHVHTVFNPDGSLRSVHDYKRELPDNMAMSVINSKYMDIMADRLRNDPAYRAMNQLEMPDESKARKFIELTSKDEELQSVLKLLKGEVKVVGSIGQPEVDTIASIPDEIGKLILVSYSICHKVKGQIPEYFSDMKRKIESVTNFSPFIYRNRMSEVFEW
ncbi:MAG: hypothetical protein V1906_01860 [Candidatus Woesearchaeota archaeon]